MEILFVLGVGILLLDYIVHIIPLCIIPRDLKTTRASKGHPMNPNLYLIIEYDDFRS
jgi:hypothetical protein